MPTPQEIMAVTPRKKKQLRKMKQIKAQQKEHTGRQPAASPLDESRQWWRKKMRKVKPYNKLLNALEGGLQRKR